MGRILDFLLGEQRDLEQRAGEEVGGLAEPPAQGPQEIAPPARSDVQPMGLGQALGLSMVYRAIVIHAVTAKQLTLQLWREDIVNADARDARLPSSSFIRRPDINMPRSAFLEQNVVSLAGNGNAYWLKQFDPQGRIVNVEILNPLDMRIVREKGRTEYWYGARTQPYLEHEVQHLKLLRVPGSLYGLGPVQSARVELEGARDLRDYSSNWFREGGVPTGTLTSDNIISADQAAMAKQQWNSTQGGKRDIAILGQGLRYEAMFLKPADAQFLESRQFTTTEIARLFGVPSSLMLANVQGSSQTYQNVEQDWLGFIRFSHMQYLIEIEDALSAVLPRGQYAKFNVEALLRTDTKTRYESYASGINAGWLKRSEVRRIENLPEVAGIDDVKPAPAPAAAPAPEDTEKETPADD